MKKRIDTVDPASLSRPERHVYRAQGRSAVELVKSRGGCWFCLRRANDSDLNQWGYDRCGKVMPATFLKPGCTFEPDPERIDTGGKKA